MNLCTLRLCSLTCCTLVDPRIGAFSDELDGYPTELSHDCTHNETEFRGWGHVIASTRL